MTHASLFSGIGGFDYAAKLMGWQNIFTCEKDEYCQIALKSHFPTSIHHQDINETDFNVYRGRIDVLSGGFPCQPYSLAGKRLGTADARHLWPQMLRAVREIRPTWVVGENVRGLINWSEGLVFEDAQAELEAEGYEVFSFVLLACGVGAPHERNRVWIIAHTNSNQCYPGQKQCEQPRETFIAGNGSSDVLHTNSKQCQQQRFCPNGNQQGQLSSRYNETTTNGDGFGWLQKLCNSKPALTPQGVPDWRGFPTESPVCSRVNGFPFRLASYSVPRWRRESIKAYGNAVVPQVVIQIFKTIAQYEQLINQ